MACWFRAWTPGATGRVGSRRGGNSSRPAAQAPGKSKRKAPNRATRRLSVAIGNDQVGLRAAKAVGSTQALLPLTAFIGHSASPPDPWACSIARLSGELSKTVKPTRHASRSHDPSSHPCFGALPLRASESKSGGRFFLTGIRDCVTTAPVRLPGLNCARRKEIYGGQC